MLFRSAQTDIVHIHSIWTFPTLVAYYLATKLNKKIILSPRSSLFAESLKKSKIKKWIIRHVFVNDLLKKSSVIRASSKQELDEIGFLGDFNVNLVPNGIDINEFPSTLTKETARHFLGLPSDSKIVSFISRIHKRKGFSLLVDAWININKHKNEPSCLMVAGPIDDQDYFNDQTLKISESGLNDRFFYFGMLTGVARIHAFKAGDLFVLPSAFENFGMCLAESMLAATPVITSTNTPWEVINELSAGWCIDSENLESTLYLALNSDLTQTGLTAKNFITENFSHTKMAERVSHIYNSIHSNLP